MTALLWAAAALGGLIAIFELLRWLSGLSGQVTTSWLATFTGMVGYVSAADLGTVMDAQTASLSLMVAGLFMKYTRLRTTGPTTALGVKPKWGR